MMWLNAHTNDPQMIVKSHHLRHHHLITGYGFTQGFVAFVFILDEVIFYQMAFEAGGQDL